MIVELSQGLNKYLSTVGVKQIYAIYKYYLKHFIEGFLLSFGSILGAVAGINYVLQRQPDFFGNLTGSGSRNISVKNPEDIKHSLQELQLDQAVYEQVMGIIQLLKSPLGETEKIRRELFQVKASKGILLEGPPGNGKTHLAKAIAKEAGYHLIEVSGPNMHKKFLGDSEALLANIFKAAKKNQPCVIFVDEIDALIPKREANDGSAIGKHYTSLTDKFLEEMTHIDDNDQILVIGATNFIARLDRAATRRGRFDAKICLSLPDAEQRQRIMSAEFDRLKLPQSAEIESFRKNLIERLTILTEKFSPIELRSVFKDAKLYCYEHKLGNYTVDVFVNAAIQIQSQERLKMRN